MSESETVYVAISYRNQSNVHHTDPDCYKLRRSRSVVAKPKSVLFHDTRLCSACGGVEGPKDRGKSPMAGSNLDDYCRACQHPKAAGETCEWCERYESVMGAFA